MKAISLILAGGFGLAALAVAAPAAAQHYPGYPPPPPNYGYPGYGYQNNNVVGQVLGQILGYGRYPYGNYGYNQYGNQSMAVDQCARSVEARLNGYRGGYYGYGNMPYGGQYGYNGYAGGGARVLGITRVDRKSYGLKVRGVASSGYQGYQGYGRPGYGSYGYNAGADLSWSCEVRYDGRIRDIDLKRRTAYWRGY
ncbi:MAG TPA: hypothetical protein VJ775_04980 [Sphingomicrobium sp.]|nr:hypothetical protein [Sphingomicrobium sp.]